MTIAWPTREAGTPAARNSLAADQLRQVARVLHRVGEVELVHAVEALVVLELVHVQREAGLVVDAAQAAGRALRRGCRRPCSSLSPSFSVAFTYFRGSRRSDSSSFLSSLDLEVDDLAVLEERVALLGRRRRRPRVAGRPARTEWREGRDRPLPADNPRHVSLRGYAAAQSRIPPAFPSAPHATQEVPCPYNGWKTRQPQRIRHAQVASGKIKSGLAKTKGVFTGVFDLLRGKGKVDQAFLDELEKRLYLADVGTQATAVIVDRVRQAFRDKEITGEVEEFVKQATPRPARRRERRASTTQPSGPTVVMIAGVNGSGKTTSIAKLAKRLQDRRQEGAGGGVRHVPRRGGRATDHLGRAHRLRHRQAGAGRATRRRWPTTPARRRRPAGSTC